MWWALVSSVALGLGFLQVISIVWQAAIFFWRFYALRELNLPSRYGAKSWVAITGADGGMGKLLAREFARRGFNLLLLGYASCNDVADQMRAEFGIETKVVQKDFGRAWEPDFFTDIEDALKQIDLSVLVNNVAHRTGWIPSHSQPAHDVVETISCGTVVQARLTQLAIRRFMERDPALKSAVIFMTALCVVPNFGLSIPLSNTIRSTFLAVYEASNAFGYFHAMSLCDEYSSSIYSERLDILNVTPGAVITENTKVLKFNPFHATADNFVKQIMIFLGNVQGTTCASPVHVAATALASLFPMATTIGPYSAPATGKILATNYMRMRQSASQ